MRQDAHKSKHQFLLQLLSYSVTVARSPSKRLHNVMLNLLRFTKKFLLSAFCCLLTATKNVLLRFSPLPKGVWWMLRENLGSALRLGLAKLSSYSVSFHFFQKTSLGTIFCLTAVLILLEH